MSYPKEIFGAAINEMAMRRNSAKQTASERREEISVKFPLLDKTQRTLASAAAKLANSVLSGGEGLDDIRYENEQARRLYKKQLKDAGYPEDYTSVRYRCKICDDTGFIDGKQCSCLKKLLGQLMMKRLGIEKSLESCSFKNFSLNYYSDKAEGESYSPRERMRNYLERCLEWSDKFPDIKGNLLFTGPTGIGKTHLSLAIAKAVIEKGCDVLYYPFGNLITLLEAERFSRDGDYAAGIKPLLNCDLLILDDLGSEFTSPFGQSLLYELINTRLVAAKPMVISTNLSLQEIESRYGDRIFSRLAGGYETLLFRGNDIRLIKRYGSDVF